MKNATQHKNGGKNTYRDMPGDDFLPQHICQTQKQGYATNLTKTSSTGLTGVRKTYHHVQAAGQLLQYTCIAGLDGLLHQRKRSGTRLGINIRGELTCCRPRSHLCRERHKKEATTYQCRIERVAAQTAKRHFANANGYQSTNKDNPYWKVGRQVEAQQQAGKDGRPIKNGGFLLQNVFGDAPFKKHTGCNTRSQNDQRTESEANQRHQQRRNQRDDDTIHIAFHTVISMSVGRQ